MQAIRLLLTLLGTVAPHHRHHDGNGGRMPPTSPSWAPGHSYDALRTGGVGGQRCVAPTVPSRPPPRFQSPRVGFRFARCVSSDGRPDPCGILPGQLRWPK
jgi:hypothetical protein